MRAAALALVLLAGCLIGCHAKVEASTEPNAPPATRTVPAGPTPSVDGKHQVVELGEGKFKGDLVVGGSHNHVRGAGWGKTIIDGRLLMTGNHNSVSGLTIEGGGTIEGNHNDATKAQLHGDVTTSGDKDRNE